MTLGPLSPLASRSQWVLVLLVPRPSGKTDKLPLDPRTLTPADAHSPANWLDYSTAAAQAAGLGPTFTLGFVLTAADPFWCLDIDGAATPTGWSSLALELCAALPGTAVEVSQSGQGLHIWGQGPVPPHSKKNTEHRLELYTEARFIALGRPGATGQMAASCPGIAAVAARYFPPRTEAASVPDEGPRADWRGPEDDAELIRRAMLSRSAAATFGGGVSFADLWHADAAVLSKRWPPDAHSSEPFDRSSADAAMAQHLAFWTGCDQARIDRLMRQSALKREKWEREDYMARTIGNACGMQRDVLQDKPSAAEVVAAGISSEAVMTVVEGRTYLNREDQQKMFAGCVYVVDLHKALVPGGHLLNPDRFKAYFGGFSFAMDERNERTTRNAWEAFTESQMLRAPRAEGICFRPDLPPATILHEPGRRRVNTWWPAPVANTPGDPSRFLQHLAKILPHVRDQQIVLSYLAAMVQYPGRKFQWAILLQGVEGNGKTVISRCAAEALGRRYVHWPNARRLEAQFNGWLYGNLAYLVEDVHTKEGSELIEQLKPMITGEDGYEVESKGVDQVSREICGNFIFNTNHRKSLPKTRNDRRLAIFFCAQQNVSDLPRDGMDGNYMSDLYGWLKGGGYAIVTHYLSTYQIPDDLNPATKCHRAPQTSSTEAAIAESLGGVEQEILEAIGESRAGFKGGWVSSAALEKLLRERNLAHRLPLNKRREAMQALGYDWHPALDQGRVDNPVMPDGVKTKLFVQRNHESLQVFKASEVARMYTKAQGIA